MASRYVWMMAVLVLAMVVAENGRMCMADDNNNNDQNQEDDKGIMKSLHDKAESWTDWAKNKISGKWSTDEGGEGGHSVESNEAGHSIESSGQPTWVTTSLDGVRGTSSEAEFEAGLNDGASKDPGASFRSTNAGYSNSGDQDGHDHDQ